MSSLAEALRTSPTRTAIYDSIWGSVSIHLLSETLAEVRLEGLSEGSMTLQDAMALIEKLGIPADQGWSAGTNE